MRNYERVSEEHQVTACCALVPSKPDESLSLCKSSALAFSTSKPATCLPLKLVIYNNWFLRFYTCIKSLLVGPLYHIQCLAVLLIHPRKVTQTFVTVARCCFTSVCTIPDRR